MPKPIQQGTSPFLPSHLNDRCSCAHTHILQVHTCTQAHTPHSNAHVHTHVHIQIHTCAWIYTPTCVCTHTHTLARVHTGVPGSLSSLVCLGPTMRKCHSEDPRATSTDAQHSAIPAFSHIRLLPPRPTCFPSHLPGSSRFPSGMAWNSLLAGARTGPSCLPSSLLSFSWTFMLHTPQKELQLLLALYLTCSSHSLSTWYTPGGPLRCS